MSSLMIRIGLRRLLQRADKASLSGLAYFRFR
jgi:hypothetical protein